MDLGFQKKIRKIIPLAASLLFLAVGLAAQNKTYCVNVDDSKVPSLVNYLTLTLNVNVGTCASVSVTANGVAIAATYNSSTQICSFSTSATAMVVTAVNWTAGGTGVATKATLYNNYGWAYSQTFDDVRQTQYDNAKPLLDSLGLKAGLSAVVSWLESGNNYYQTWTEIRAFLADGWDVYNHTWDHPDPVTCATWVTEFGQDETAFQTELPGYNVTHAVMPYEVSIANCAGYPASYLLSGELDDGPAYTNVSAPLASSNTLIVARNGIYGIDGAVLPAIEANCSNAANSGSAAWVIYITHSVTAGDGAAADQYSTNVNTLSTLYNYLLTNWGPSGKNNMWFASAGRVQDYLFTRDNAVVSNCTVSGSPTDTPLPSPSFSPSPTFTHSPTSTVSPTPRPTPDACQDVVAVNCGGAAYTSATLGLTFGADQAYVAGSAPGAAGSYGYLAADAGTAYATTNTFTGSDSADATLYNSQYYGATVGYDFSVPNGPAYVTFYWAETYATATGQRVFSVTINGTTVESNLDLYAVSGGENVTYSATFPVTVTNGVINIVATASANSAEFQAISVQAGAPCTASPTHSPTWSVTPTPTRTASPSPSDTATALPSASVTPSKTPSVTSSATPSATRTVTATPTSTLTLSYSPTAQGSPTSSFTGSPSGTVTPLPSATKSFTPGPSLTSSQTPTDSPTAQSSPTATLSFTASPMDSATASPTPATDTPSVTATSTGSPTATPSATLTLTASPVDSATDTPTPATDTPSTTSTATPTLTPSATPSFTLSASPSGTTTPSVSATVTPMFDASATPTFTAQPTAQPTPFLASVLPQSLTAGVPVDLTLTGINFAQGDWVLVNGTAYQPLSLSSTQIVVALPGQAQSLDPGIPVLIGSSPSGSVVESNTKYLPVLKPADTATATPAPGGPLTITGLEPVPNPNPSQLALKLGGPADVVTVRAFTKALVLAEEFTYSNNLREGWQSVPLPASWSGLPDGIYYVQVRAQRGETLSTPKFVKAMILK